MTSGRHIRAVGEDDGQSNDESVIENEQDQSTDDTLTLDEEVDSDTLEGEEFLEESLNEASDYSWIAPTFAILLVASWTGFFAWTHHQAMLAGADMQQWIQWISTWSLPTLLICVVWLIALRNSTREAHRFADSAAALSRESSELELRLTTVNRELSLAREFLASQSLELESLGRVASERLSSNAEELQNLIHKNGEQVQSIADVSDTAMGNMSKLRDDLPVIANSARDVSSQIGNAGVIAHEQTEQLVNGFERLNQFGKATGQHIEELKKRIDVVLHHYAAELGKLDSFTTKRFDDLIQRSEDFRTNLDSREVDALAAIERRRGKLQDSISELSEELSAAQESSIASLQEAREELNGEFAMLRETILGFEKEAADTAQERIRLLTQKTAEFDENLAARSAKFDEEISRREDALGTNATQASELFEQRLAALDEALEERGEVHIANAQKLAEQSEAIRASLAELNGQISAATELGQQADTGLAGALEGFSAKVADAEGQMAQSKEALAELTEDGIRLLEIIQSGARQSREDLKESLQEALDSLDNVEERGAAVNAVINQSNALSDELANYVLSTKEKVEGIESAIDSTQTKFAEQSEKELAHIANLRSEMETLAKDGEAITEKTRDTLISAIKELEASSKSAFASLESGMDESLNASADKISGKASEALERNLKETTEASIARLEEAASSASEMGRESALQLRDQLAKVNELTNNLEQRVTRAREMAEEQFDDGFARRMALIMESLNSNAIDISKSLSNDVTDTAWAAYLKGDRGIFTRRAVSLIDTTESREVVELYQSDEGFREHVNRFIHDFEAMLRSILSTRDGNALGVTVLGSEVGKLYVALAQAIERLRD